jgi:tRNA U34 2-thiouridine synthase MnmA/TrmU
MVPGRRSDEAGGTFPGPRVTTAKPGAQGQPGDLFPRQDSVPGVCEVHLGQKPGIIVDASTGKTLGQHQGVWFFTIGQREGLGLGAGPWYVVQKDLTSNTLYVAHRDRRSRYGCKQFAISDVHWISAEPATSALQTKLRHTPHLEDCSIRALPEGRWEVTLNNPDFGVAPGQSAILYQGDICLGGGVIEISL